MHARRHIGVAAMGALALAASILGPHAGPAAAQPTGMAQYSLQAVASPIDPTFTQLLGINDHQLIAGYYGSGQAVNGILHPNKGFTLGLPASFSYENFPRSTQTQVIALNNRGDTAGFYVDRAGRTHGFLDVGGRFNTVDMPRRNFSQILGLNDNDQAAGFFQDGQGQDHAFIRQSNGAFVQIPLANSQATGINDAGVVVGFTQPSTTRSSGFILQGRRLTRLDYPGSTFTQALGENNRGQVVGFYNDGAGNAHGFVYDMRTRAWQVVDAPGAGATTVNGINDAGSIVGFFTDVNGNTVGLVGALQVGQVSPLAQPTSTSAPSTTTVSIGLVLPLSGQDAALGQSAENGARLAIDQANAAHLLPGVMFTLIARDDAGANGTPDGATGAAAVTSLIGDPHVAGIIGPFDTATALAELPLANRAGIAMISPSAGNPCLTNNDALAGCSGANDLLPTVRPTGSVTFFRTIAADPLQGMVMADYLYATRHLKTAYVIDNATPYGIDEATSFGNEWKKLGGALVGNATVAEGTASFINLLTQSAVRKPDLIFFGGSDPASGTPDSILIRQQMLQIPSLKSTAFAGGDGIRTQAFVQKVGLLGGQVWSTLTPADATTISSAATFVQQYQQQYGTPGRYSASGYDSANVLLGAIKAAIMGGTQPPSAAGAAAPSFRKAVIAALAQTSASGVTGPISFTATGDVAQGLISIEQPATVNNATDWKQVANL